MRRGPAVTCPILSVYAKGACPKPIASCVSSSFHVHDLHMLPRRTVYHQWGQGKNRLLRFSKSGNEDIEDAYATHYVWHRSQEKKRQVIDQSMPERSDEA